MHCAVNGCTLSPTSPRLRYSNFYYFLPSLLFFPPPSPFLEVRTSSVSANSSIATFHRTACAAINIRAAMYPAAALFSFLSLPRSWGGLFSSSFLFPSFPHQPYPPLTPAPTSQTVTTPVVLHCSRWRKLWKVTPTRRRNTKERYTKMVRRERRTRA